MSGQSRIVPIEACHEIGGESCVVPTRDSLTLEDVHEHQSQNVQPRVQSASAFALRASA
jgi:hypothetical protein